MSGIVLRYRKPDWDNWIFWPCDNEQQAKEVRDLLESRGYVVEGI